MGPVCYLLRRRQRQGLICEIWPKLQGAKALGFPECQFRRKKWESPEKRRRRRDTVKHQEIIWLCLIKGGIHFLLAKKPLNLQENVPRDIVREHDPLEN